MEQTVSSELAAGGLHCANGHLIIQLVCGIRYLYNIEKKLQLKLISFDSKVSTRLRIFSQISLIFDPLKF